MTDVPAMIRDWHVNELQADYGLEGARLVMGSPLWGETYVDHFLEYCLPSLLANGMGTDRMGKCAIVMFVDGPTEQRLRGLPIPIQIRRLPGPIMEGLYREPGHKYALLAAVHNLLIHQAAKVGAGFHMTVADTIYSDRYFEGLGFLSRQHEAIAHTGFAIVADTGLPALAPHRFMDALKISAAELGALGWEHLNPQWASWTMDGITDFAMMPNSHYIHWRGRKSVRIHCAHQSAAWIGPEICRKVSPALGGTIDSELPRYFAGAEPYQPTLDDEMAYIVIAGATEPTPRIPFAEFKREFWRFIGNDRRFLPIFMKPCVMRVPLDENAPSEAELDERLARMMERLEEGR